MLNKVILIGNVGADPEIRTLESGVKVTRLRLATTERIRRGEEWVDHTEWHSVVLWRNLADIADRFVRKGSQIYVEGAIRTNEWTDKEGGKHSAIEIVASDMKLLGRRQDSQQTAQAASQAKPAAPQAQPAAPAADVDDMPF